MDVEELQKEAKEYISEWTIRKDSPPPFTCKQLVILAIAIRGIPLSSQDVFVWICRTFAFYRSIGPTAVWNYLLANDTDSTPCQPLRYPHGRILPSGFRRAQQVYRFPADIKIDEVEVGDIDSDVANLPLLQVNTTSALLYLRSQREDREPTGCFAFLRLPAELRNEIYKLALGFPRSGVQIGRYAQDPSGMVYLATREFDRADDDLCWSRRRNICAGRMSDLLSLLLVNHQICSEAFYIFGAINTFYFTSASHMIFILRRMSQQHRDQISRLAFHYAPDFSCVRGLRTAFEIMTQMRRLSVLSMYMDEQAFRRFYHFYPDKSTVELMLGLETIPKLNGSVTIDLYGHYPPIIAKILGPAD